MFTVILFIYAKICGNRVTHGAFYNFCKVYEKKLKSLQLKKEKDGCSYLAIGWYEYNLYGLLYLADSYIAKMVCFGNGVMELYMCENAVFFLPVSVACWLSWSHDTLLCVLIYNSM